MTAKSSDSEKELIQESSTWDFFCMFYWLWKSIWQSRLGNSHGTTEIDWRGLEGHNTGSCTLSGT